MDNGKYIKQISDALARKSDNNLSKLGVTFSQIRILVFLKNQTEKSATFKEIEKMMKVSQPAIVGLAKRLESRGFATSMADPYDKRVKHLKITEKGLEVCEKAKVDLILTENQLIEALSEEEKVQFSALLKKVAESFK